MKTMLRLSLLLFPLIILSTTLAQTYQGPAVGSVPNGGTVNTGTFYKSTDIGVPKERGTRNVITPFKDPVSIDFGSIANPIRSFYVEDPNVNSNSSIEGSPSILLKSFKGMTMGNSIPPDPHMAVGPTHIITTVNVSFSIWDKEGNLVKTINPDTWFQGLVSNPGCFDPQILYDHFDKKWIMSWDSQNDALQRAHFMVAVSDDSIPTGTWYVWALPANVNGTTVVSNWGDYPQIGFDRNAIYINSRQFSFAGSYQYNKIRIINKSEIYNNPGGALSWKDIWDITDPQVGATYKPDKIIPSIYYGFDDIQFFLHIPNNGANFISLYKMTDPTGTPVLTRTNIFVENFSGAPNANQLGGSTTLIDANQSGMKTQPIFRDGFLWATHSIANPTAPQYAAMRYYKVNTTNSSLVESGTLGAANYWYIFPTLAVDKDQNIAITYSRSGTTEYCGAYYTTRLKNDPPGLSGSQILQTGKGNYVVTFSGTRNRWGDYTGIYLDPSDENNIWMHTEYVEATNRWGTWIGKVRMVPFSGAYVYTVDDSLDFGELDFDVNQLSDTLSATIFNYGSDTLNISNIPTSFGQFKLVSNLTYPVKLSSYQSLTLDFVFAPTTNGQFSTIYPVTNNDPNFSGILLKGYAYKIFPASNNIIYASSGSSNEGNILSINPSTGAGTILGPSLFSEVTDIAIHPKTNISYGVTASGNNTSILRVNSLNGDAHKLLEVNLANPKSIAFDTSGTLYALLKNGRIHTVDLVTGSTNLVLDTNFTVASIAFNPLNNELWGTSSALISNRDRVFKIDIVNVDTTVIGKTGFNTITNNITFDGIGILYGITGSSSQINNLIRIDTSSAVGTLVGSIGFKHITGIGLTSNSVTSVRDDRSGSNIPNNYVLKQNYPNPFNPSTTIEFALPISSQIKVKIYNLLGQVVKVLYDGIKQEGIHKLNWNSDDTNGNSLSSGIYFYELSAKGLDGSEFSQLRKMILIK